MSYERRRSNGKDNGGHLEGACGGDCGGADDEEEELRGVDDPNVLDAVFKLFLEREKEAERDGE